MSGIKNYRTTAGNNTSVGGISIAEGMLPSNINNAFRAFAADIREFYNDSQWVIYGDGDGAHTFAYVSGTAFTVAGANVTAFYHAGRRVKAVGSSTGTIVGTIASSTFSTNTTVNVTWDSGSLQNETLVIYVGILSKTNSSIPTGIISGSNLASGLLVDASSQSGSTPNDTTIFTTSASDARYFRQDSTETIASGDAWSNSDTRVATTAAISNRIIDIVDDVGGFVPIANETSFPNANPDVNNGTGTIISITALSTNLTSNSSGVITISNGTIGNSTVTLNGCGNTVTFASGFGLLVETTTTLNTYTFVRLVPKASEVSTVAANATNISSAGANTTNINTVAGQISPTNNIATLAGISGLSALASAESSGHVTNVSNNLSGVTSFAERYRVASSAPTSSLDVGDLYFDTTANELKVYKSSGWAAAGSSVNGTSKRFTYTASSNQTTFTGSDNNSQTLSYDSPFIDCYLNGIKLVNGTDVTVTSGNSVVLASGAAAGDTLDLIAFGTFNVAAINAANITAGTLNLDRIPTITNAKSDNNSITINGSSVVLGGSVTVGETKPTVANVSQTIAPATATTINITGTNFVSIPQVEFVKTDGSVTVANTISFTSSTSLSVNVTLASGNYYVRVENPDGNAGRSTNNIITASTAPTFTTNAGSLGTFAGNFSGNLATIAGTSDSSITFSEVGSNLTTANVTLSSAGVLATTDFGGTSTTATQYNFTVRITDAEGQTADRSFSLTSSFGATGGGQFN